MKGCDGTGHILGTFSTHRSLSGCPLSVRIAELQQQSDTKTCPTPGCDGSGNTKSMYTFHRSVQRCPLMREKLDEYKGVLTLRQVEDILTGKAPFPFEPNSVNKKPVSLVPADTKPANSNKQAADRTVTRNGENKLPKTNKVPSPSPNSDAYNTRRSE